jgi:hypothetical protein
LSCLSPPLDAVRHCGDEHILFVECRHIPPMIDHVVEKYVLCALLVYLLKQILSNKVSGQCLRVSVQEFDLILYRVKQTKLVSLVNRSTIGVAQSLGDSAKLNAVLVISSAPRYSYLFGEVCIPENIEREGVIGIWYFVIAHNFVYLFAKY